MKALAAFLLVFFFTLPVWGQNRGGFVNPQPFIQGSFGNAVFPGGTAAFPGIHRTFGNAVFPSGSGFPRLVVPGSVTDPTFLFRPGSAFGRPGGGARGSRRGNAVLVPYAVPVYAGGFYDNPYLGEDAPVPQQPQPQPNIIIVYPPMQPVAQGPSGDNLASAGPADTSAQAVSAEPAPPEAEHYLIAFKDHTIYAAVAFWVDHDTLHYFTPGNTHNQVSLSLIDKPLTERLNQESGIDMHLP